MTTIDGIRQPGTLHGIDGATMGRLRELSRITGKTPAVLVAEAVAKFAPPVETRSSRGATPGDGRAAGDSTTPAAVLPHVHLGGVCVYGRNCTA